MWVETNITAIEVLPSWTIQIDFEWEHRDRCFIEYHELLSMLAEAETKTAKSIDRYYNVKWLKWYIEQWQEDAFNDDWSIFTIEQADGECFEKLKEEYDFDTLDMYIQRK